MARDVPESAEAGTKGKGKASATAASRRRSSAATSKGDHLAGYLLRQWRMPVWLSDSLMLAVEVFHAIFAVYIPRNPNSVLLW